MWSWTFNVVCSLLNIQCRLLTVGSYLLHVASCIYWVKPDEFDPIFTEHPLRRCLRYIQPSVASVIWCELSNWWFALVEYWRTDYEIQCKRIFVSRSRFSGHQAARHTVVNLSSRSSQMWPAIISTGLGVTPSNDTRAIREWSLNVTKNVACW